MRSTSSLGNCPKQMERIGDQYLKKKKKKLARNHHQFARTGEKKKKKNKPGANLAFPKIVFCRMFHMQNVFYEKRSSLVKIVLKSPQNISPSSGVLQSLMQNVLKIKFLLTCLKTGFLKMLV